MPAINTKSGTRKWLSVKMALACSAKVFSGGLGSPGNWQRKRLLPLNPIAPFHALSIAHHFLPAGAISSRIFLTPG